MAPSSSRARFPRSTQSMSMNPLNPSGIPTPGAVQPEPPNPYSRRVLQEVAIPVHRPNRSTKKSPAVASVQDSASTASGSGTRDTSVDFDTPDTSLITTPAESSSGSAKTGMTTTIQSNKRKRTSHSSISGEGAQADVSADAELAQQLQEDEYNQVGNEAGPSRYEQGLASRLVEDAHTSESESEESDFEPLAVQGKRRKFLSSIPKPATKAREGTRNTKNQQSAPGAVEDDAALSSDLSSVFEFNDSSFVDSDDDDALDPNIPIDADALLNLNTQRGWRRYREQVREARMNRMEQRAFDRKQRRRMKLEGSHPEIKTMWKELENVPIITPVKAQQPASITRTLKPFQLEGLDWMVKQEKTHYKGGLLGDEMGMGKTIQAVSLIMSDHPAQDPTLVVVPPVALMQWANEIREYTNGQLNVLVYHGSNAKSKNLTKSQIKKFDVIMISYNSLESLYRKETKGWTRGDEIIKEDSPMHCIKFHRIILDEAHSIKQRTTGVAKSCFALQGTYKWCLSGTPVQNRIGEFFSLLRFLEVRPFADYFCEKCSCAQLHWQLTEDHMCASCGHSGAEHVSVFNQELLNPITGDSATDREEALGKLHMITARVMLRRMKKDYTASMELPPKEVLIHNEFFGEIERDFSKSIMTNSTRTFDRYVSRGVMLNNYANIFGLIMQMRQVANHPDLLLKKHAEIGQNVLVCNICDEPAEDPVRSACKHEFCRTCLKTYVQSSEGAGETVVECPRCHIGLSIDWEQPEIVQDEELVKKNSIINRIKMDDWTSSTKIEMLIYELYKLRSKKQTLKSIVFSQFTSMLQLVEWRLRRAGFNTVILDGSMSPVQRQRSIDYFMKNPDVEVFLVSLKAGGVALNLTEASRVFIVDPWWNPAAEWQSADRCHRIGQRRPCVITRLCIEDSVESRMVMLQEKKARMISGTINNDKVAMEKLTPEDLQFLFRGT